MTKTHALGTVQLAIMRVLWEMGEATVTQVHKVMFEQRGLAPTTVATMLTKMEKRGIVTHRTEGRKYVYRPAVSEGEVKQSMVADLKDKLFEGNVAALVSHLIAEHEVEPEELDQLRSLIDQKEKER